MSATAADLVVASRHLEAERQPVAAGRPARPASSRARRPRPTTGGAAQQRRRRRPTLSRGRPDGRPDATRSGLPSAAEHPTRSADRRGRDEQRTHEVGIRADAQRPMAASASGRGALPGGKTAASSNSQVNSDRSARARRAGWDDRVTRSGYRADSTPRGLVRSAGGATGAGRAVPCGARLSRGGIVRSWPARVRLR